MANTPEDEPFLDQVVAGLSLAAGLELGRAHKETDHIERMAMEARASLYAQAAHALIHHTGPAWQTMMKEKPDAR